MSHIWLGNNFSDKIFQLFVKKKKKKKDIQDKWLEMLNLNGRVKKNNNVIRLEIFFFLFNGKR